MVVYNRILPNASFGPSAYYTLTAIVIGVGSIIVVDYIFKVLRAYFLDKSGSIMEKKSSNDVFNRTSLGTLSSNHGSGCSNQVVPKTIAITPTKKIGIHVKVWKIRLSTFLNLQAKWSFQNNNIKKNFQQRIFFNRSHFQPL